MDSASSHHLMLKRFVPAERERLLEFLKSADMKGGGTLRAQWNKQDKSYTLYVSGKHLSMRKLLGGLIPIIDSGKEEREAKQRVAVQMLNRTFALALGSDGRTLMFKNESSAVKISDVLGKLKTIDVPAAKSSAHSSRSDSMSSADDRSLAADDESTSRERSRGSDSKSSSETSVSEQEAAGDSDVPVLERAAGMRSAPLRVAPTSTASAERVEIRQVPSTSEKHVLFRRMSEFADVKGVNVGGKSGSERVRLEGVYYQMKKPAAEGGAGERVKTMFKGDTSIMAELVASRIARATLPPQDRELVPEVTLLQNEATHSVGLVSRYLPGARGDLDSYFFKEVYGTEKPKTFKGHVKIEFDGKKACLRLGTEKLELPDEAARDLVRHLVRDARFGDHDVNPGNMMVVMKDGKLRIGRIDYGHAFNDLIAAGNPLIGGGGIQDKNGNRVLDFFNRGKVLGSAMTKLWRDYKGLVPSKLLAEVLREEAEVGKAALVTGLADAQAQVLQLVESLRSDKHRDAPNELQGIVDSLVRICGNMGVTISSEGAADSVIKDAFDKLSTVLAQANSDFAYVADLCDLQVDLNQFVSEHVHAQSSVDKLLIPDDYVHRYKALAGETAGGVVWFKSDRHIPAFEGGLRDYISRRAAVHQQDGKSAAAALVDVSSDFDSDSDAD